MRVKWILSKCAHLHSPNLSKIKNVDVTFGADKLQVLHGTSHSSITHTYSALIVTNRVAFLPQTTIQFDPSVDLTHWRKSFVDVDPSSFLVNEDQKATIDSFLFTYLDNIWKKVVAEEETKKLEALKRIKEEEK